MKNNRMRVDAVWGSVDGSVRELSNDLCVWIPANPSDVCVFANVDVRVGGPQKELVSVGVVAGTGLGFSRQFSGDYRFIARAVVMASWDTGVFCRWVAERVEASTRGASTIRDAIGGLREHFDCEYVYSMLWAAPLAHPEGRLILSSPVAVGIRRLGRWMPANPLDVALHVSMRVRWSAGQAKQGATARLEVLVATPAAMSAKTRRSAILHHGPLLLIDRYDYDILWLALSGKVGECQAARWVDTRDRLQHYFRVIPGG